MELERTPGQFYPQDLPTLFSNPTADILWLWEPFIPTEALVLLSAYMKVGKSTLIYALISAMVNGKDFLGHKTTKTNILILAVEESERDVRNRLLNFGVNEKDGIYVHIGRMTTSPENYSRVKKFLKEKNIGLVVVDTLSTFISVEDENSNSEVLRAVTPLLDIAHGEKVTVIMVHHNNKGEGDGGKGIRGASSLFGLVDQAIILKYHGSHKGRFRRVETLGRYDETPRETIIEMDDNYGYTSIGSEADAVVDQIQLEVRTVLIALGVPATLVEISEQLPQRKLKAIQKALSPPPVWIKREGKGVRGDPFKFSVEKVWAEDATTSQRQLIPGEWTHPSSSQPSSYDEQEPLF